MRDNPPEAAQRAPGQKHTQPVLHDFARQPSQQRHDRLSEQDQGRCDQDQQEVLHHVCLEQQTAEGI